MGESSYLKGGVFLLRETAPGEVFAPEDFSAEELLYGKTAADFMENEVQPLSDRIEEKDLALSRSLLAKAGELGLLMADVPEEYGGLGLEKTACALVAENVSGQGSFQTMVMAHTGIGTLPIVYYGTEAQRKKYLPGLADGSMIGCYALTEPGAGSDAMGLKTRAVLNEAGSHYVLNGNKQFITNASFADVFTVFAKVDGAGITAFIVEKGTRGLSVGAEEHKMGIRGSTTCTVNFTDVAVPVENLLGELGKGHKIAFNILNIGRFKLGMCAVGAARRTLSEALAYTLERKQFGKRIAEFQALREKLARMYARIFSAEASAFRVAGLLEGMLKGAADKYGEAALDSIEEFNVECAVMKVLGSEMNDFVADEGVQCLGGYGFCAEYPMERYYRDNRINRIFEGTNEINRIVIANMLMRKAAAGSLDLFGTGREAFVPGVRGEGPLAEEKLAVANMKKMAAGVISLACEKYGKGASSEQGILLRIADLVILAFEAESALLRALKCPPPKAELALASARLVCEENMESALAATLSCLVALGAPKPLEAVAALGRRDPADVIGLAQAIGSKLVEMERVAF